MKSESHSKDRYQVAQEMDCSPETKRDKIIAIVIVIVAIICIALTVKYGYLIDRL